MTTQPPVGPLDSESVKPGDLLHHARGLVVVRMVEPEVGLHVGYAWTDGVQLVDVFEAFSFIGRPDADGWIKCRFRSPPDYLRGVRVEAKTYNDLIRPPQKSQNVAWTNMVAFRLPSQAGEGHVSGNAENTDTSSGHVKKTTEIEHVVVLPPQEGEGAEAYVGDVGDLLKRARNAVRNGGTIKNLDHANDVVLIDKLADALEATTTPPTDPRLDRAIEALEPFAAMSEVGDQRPSDDAVWAGQDGKHITFGDFRRARQALASIRGEA